jgi:hypothetical protein
MIVLKNGMTQATAGNLQAKIVEGFAIIIAAHFDKGMLCDLDVVEIEGVTPFVGLVLPEHPLLIPTVIIDNAIVSYRAFKQN